MLPVFPATSPRSPSNARSVHTGISCTDVGKGTIDRESASEIEWMASGARRTMVAVAKPLQVPMSFLRMMVSFALYMGAGFVIFSDRLVRMAASTLGRLLDIAEVAEIKQVLYFAQRFVGSAFFSGLVLIPLGALAIFALRAVARYRIEAGHADPVDRVRRFIASHPRWAFATMTVPGLAWSAELTSSFSSTLHYARLLHPTAHPYADGLVQLFLPALITFGLITFLVRKGVRALTAPTADRMLQVAEGTELDAEGFSFDAVAITPQTVGAVAAMVTLTFAVLCSLTSWRFVRALHETGMVAYLASYCAIALGGAYLFARKSKIAVGLDGVLVGGTTKQRFVAYRDIDHVRVLGDIIELRSRTSALLRLQLHGEDAGRRVAIVERIEAAIARARTLRADPTAAFMENASVDDLTRAADGAASYRFAAPSRDKLWEVFESPVLAPEARRAAAEALASGIDPSERPRFRIAAAQVAEPATRDRLHELLGDEEEESPEPARAMRLPA